MTYYKLSDKDYKKAVSQLRMQATGIFDFVKVDNKLPVRYMYGLEAYVPCAINEIVKLAEDFSLRCRGVEKPISIEYVRRRKSKESNAL